MTHHMLTGSEENELLETLPFDEQCGEDAELIRYLSVTHTL